MLFLMHKIKLAVLSNQMVVALWEEKGYGNNLYSQ